MSATLIDSAPRPGVEATLAASLPMYDLPEIRDATDAFWNAIASRLRMHGLEAPAGLDRGAATLEALWADPGLLLSQTCGYPLMTGLRGSVEVVGAPSYDAPGCNGVFHRGAIVVAPGAAVSTLADLRGARCAVNQLNSNTGMNLLRAEVSRLANGAPFFAEVIHTGSHAASVESVARGRADVASIDAVTLALLRRLRPSLTGAVRLLSWTLPTPGLPFITGRLRTERTRAIIRRVLAEVVADPTLISVRNELLLTGFAPVSKARYGSIPRIARIAADNGYPELC